VLNHIVKVDRQTLKVYVEASHDEIELEDLAEQLSESEPAYPRIFVPCSVICFFCSEFVLHSDCQIHFVQLQVRAR
jgi:hypothetical protein